MENIRHSSSRYRKIPGRTLMNFEYGIHGMCGKSKVELYEKVLK
jgi:hypothetical protein